MTDLDGDCLAVALRPKIAAAWRAFALWCVGGRVITWGYGIFGGNSGRVAEKLRNVQQITASSFAFAALLGDGSVVTWGSPRDGGDSSAVQDQLRQVQQIHAERRAFAAILGDGTVVTWGDAESGGDYRSARSAEECSTYLWLTRRLCCHSD